LLEIGNWVGIDITEIDCTPGDFHVGMFRAEQPSNVSEEESPTGVVWIRVSLGEFVMDSVITSPVDCSTLIYIYTVKITIKVFVHAIALSYIIMYVKTN